MPRKDKPQPENKQVKTDDSFGQQGAGGFGGPRKAEADKPKEDPKSQPSGDGE